MGNLKRDPFARLPLLRVVLVGAKPNASVRRHAETDDHRRRHGTVGVSTTKPETSHPMIRASWVLVRPALCYITTCKGGAVWFTTL